MTEKNNTDEQLYDVIVPPGVPQKVIIDITKKFKVKVVERKEKLTFANMEGEERNLLAFRGKREVVEEVEKYMMDQLKAFIGDK
jgi:hypothetical protein